MSSCFKHSCIAVVGMFCAIVLCISNTLDASCLSDPMTYSRISSSDEALNSYVRLRVQSYFPIEEHSHIHKKEDENPIIGMTEQQIAHYRNSIVLNGNFAKWFNKIDFKNISPCFQRILEKHLTELQIAYQLPSLEAQKMTIICSRKITWSNCIKLINSIYGTDKRYSKDPLSLEDSIVLIFLQSDSPNLLDYLCSDLAKDRKLYKACMNAAIDKYVHEIGIDTNLSNVEQGSKLQQDKVKTE